MARRKTEYRVELNAEDKSGPAFQSFRANIEGVEKGYERLIKTSALLAGGGALAVGFLNVARNALQAADNMGDAADRAGMTVEKYSALAYAAKQLDAEHDQLEQGVKKLSIAIANAAAGDEKYVKLFKGMGVEIRDANGNLRDTGAVLYDLANTMKAATNEQVKLAAGTELMGKGFGGLLPMLNKGANEIKRLEEEGRALGKTFDTATVESADKFNKELAKLTDQSAEFARSLTGDVVPALTNVVRAMNEARRQQGLMAAVGVGLGGIVYELLGDEPETDMERLARIVEKIESLGAAIDDMRKAGQADFMLAPKIRQMHELLALGGALEGKLRAAERIRLGASGLYDDARDRRLKPQNRDLDARALGLGGKDTEAERYARELEALYNRLDSKALGVNKKFRDELGMLHKEYRAGQMTLDQYRGRVEALIAETEFAKETAKKVTEAAKQANAEAEAAMDLNDQKVKAQEEAARSMGLEVKALEQEVKLLGLSNAEREVAIQLHALHAAGIDTTSSAVQAWMDRIRAGHKSLETFNTQVSLGNDAARMSADVLQDLMHSGSEAFDVLARKAQGFAEELALLAAQRIVLQIGASIVGGQAGQALSLQAASLGKGTIAGSVVDYASSAWSAYQGGSTAWQAISGGGATGGAAGGSAFMGSAAMWTGVAAIIAAAVAANEKFYQQGWRADNQDSGALRAGFGFSYDADRIARGLGMSDHAASLFSGSSLIARLFGRGALHADAYGVTGAFQGRDVTGQTWQDWSRPGGTFRSDLRGTDFGGLSQSQQAFLTGVIDPITSLIDRLASSLGVDAGSALAGYSHEFNLQLSENGELKSDEEIRALFQELMAGVLKDQVALVVQSSGNTALGEYVRGLTGSTEDIVNTIGAVLDLVGASEHLGNAIDVLQRGPIAALVQGLEAMRTRAADAETAFAKALGGGDPTKINAAARELEAAILDRYNREIEMVRTLQDAIEGLRQEAYQFSLAIAQRIIGVGGSRDIGAIALGRANQLRGGIGSGPIGTQVSHLQNYVGAIDTWYDARRQQITADAQAQAAAHNAIAQAQAGAASARVSQLQGELALVEQMAAIAERARAMLDEMRLSSANPLSQTGRLLLAQEDVGRLRSEYDSATGTDRAGAANRLFEALTRYRDLGMQTFDRSSPEWQSIYNEITAELTRVQGDAKGVAERSEELQRQILEAQQQANGYAAATVDAAQIAASQLQALDQEALAYYTWAEEQGALLYAEQERQHREQLNAITGGMEVELFIAQRQSEAVDLLRSIDARIAAWLASPTTPTVGTGTGTDTGTGAGTGAGSGAGGGLSVTINATGVDKASIVKAVQDAAPAIKRALATA
jgi:hypothetical protein